MDLLRKTIRLLHTNRIFPKRRLGQNFAVSSALLRRMVSYASVDEKDVVLEVGAGLGFLTELLSQRCKKVVAVEIDPRLVRMLRRRLRSLQNVELIEGDILKVHVPSFNKVVSTPPYSISSSLLFWLLKRNFDCAVLTFQKEFAERLAAPIGSKNYGRLTVNTYYRTEVELLEHVPKNLFYPPPDVDSIVVRLKPRRSPPFPVLDEEIFFKLVQSLFTQRNRKVRSAIIPFLQRRGMSRVLARKLADTLPFHDKRVRELAPEDIGTLTNEVIQRTTKKAFFNGCVFYILNNVYEPAEDTFLLAENLSVKEDDTVLDMGAGCGILGVIAAKRAKRVVAVDINPFSVRCARINAKINGVSEKMDVRLGDLFEPIGENERFDIILFNPPYLPTNHAEQETWIERAWAGGPTGRQVIDRFIDQAPNYLKQGGRILLVQSSLSNIGETIRKLEEKGLRVKVLAERKTAFERIVVIQAERT